MALKIHHLNCGSFCPNAAAHLLPTDHLSCHCLLIETNEGLVLVDTGLSQEVMRGNQNPLTDWVSHPVLKPGEAAVSQVQALGFSPHDVRHIVITHLDWDHVGGMVDFPEATVHMHEREAELMKDPGLLSFRFNTKLWSHVKKVESYSKTGEKWKGLDAVRTLRGLPPEIFLIPLPGHTSGHSGIAVETGEQALLHAGDAFFFREDLKFHWKERNKASDLLQLGLAMNNWNRLASLMKLAHLEQREPEVRLVNSHDPRLLHPQEGEI
jgi:glyoxylase-like metal-dependent hydrolase (beta-lactamase superfamily II)